MNVKKTNYKIDKAQELQRKLHLSSEKSNNRRFHILYDKVYRDDILQRAWKHVKTNGGSTGIDKVSIEAIEKYGVDKFLEEIKDDLLKGTYIPTPVRRVEISKENGKTRPLGIPIIKDRVIQAATKIVIEPIFEADFYFERETSANTES